MSIREPSVTPDPDPPEFGGRHRRRGAPHQHPIAVQRRLTENAGVAARDERRREALQRAHAELDALRWTPFQAEAIRVIRLLTAVQAASEGQLGWDKLYLADIEAPLSQLDERIQRRGREGART